MHLCVCVCVCGGGGGGGGGRGGDTYLFYPDHSCILIVFLKIVNLKM